MSRTRFLFASAALMLAAAFLVACGGGDNSEAAPESVIENATLAGVESAEVEGALDLTATGRKATSTTGRS